MIQYRLFLLIILIFSFLNANAENIDSLKSTLKNAPDSLKYSIHLNLGDIYKNTDEAKAEEEYIKAFEWSVQTQNKKGQIVSLFKMVSLSIRQNNHEKGLTLLKQNSYMLDWEECDPSKRTEYHRITAVFNTMKSENSLAIIHFQKAISIADSFHLQGLKAKAISDMANLYFHQGNYPTALKYMIEGLQLKEELKDIKGIALSKYNLGQLYRLQKDFRKALKYWTETLKIYTEINDERSTGELYGQIGTLYDQLAIPDSAMSMYEKSLSIAIKTKNNESIAANTFNIGLIQETVHQYAQALENYKNALTYYDSMELFAAKTVALNAIGKIYSDKLKNPKEGLVYLEKSHALAHTIHSLDDIKEASKALSEHYERYGNSSLSLKYFKEYTLFKDSISNDEKFRELGRIEAGYELENQLEEEKRKAAEEKAILEKNQRRHNNLQYMFIILTLLLIGIFVLVLGKRRVSPLWIDRIIFVMFLLFFEFVLIYIEPYTQNLTKGEPIWTLLINFVIAILCLPVHKLMEDKFRRQVLKNH